MTSRRPVVVVQLPERLNLRQVQAFWPEIEPVLSADQPRIVFDFSQVRHLDSAGVDMLLRCVEQSAKRDGDLKLAAIPPAAAVVLEMTRVDRLFEIFETTSDAVDSFHGLSLPASRQGVQALPSVSARSTWSGAGALGIAGD